MENGLFAYILRYSKRQQIVLTLMTIASFPFYYLSLDLPKTIINDAISGTSFPVKATINLFGLTIDFGSYAQVPYLILLCSAFLLLVLVNSGFKLFINIYRGVLGERVLRRLRLQLIDRIMKFPLSRFRRTSQGELVSMVNQETEPLGGFIGEAISLPLYQGGLLLTILVFMFVQDWKLGLAAISLYPLQAWLIPKLQKRVNLLNQQRILRMRHLAENLGEVVAGVNEVHINDNSIFFRDHFSKLLGGIFNIRVKIYKIKFMIKFLNNSFAQLTPFLFFLIGGLLVIRGDLSIGALVAALAAYKDLSPPWKELLAWYQGQADARLRYCTLTEQFHVDETVLEHTHQPTDGPDEDIPSLPMAANNVSLKRLDGVVELDVVSLSVDRGEWISLVGTGTNGKNGLAQLFGRLKSPTSGKMLIAGKNAEQIPRASSAHTIAYIGHDSYLFAGTISDNLLLSLKRRPQQRVIEQHSTDETIEFRNWEQEAHLSGNSEVAQNADWVDYQIAGATDADELRIRIEQVLNTVCGTEDLVRNALARTIDPEEHPDLTNAIIKARDMFKEQVIARGLGSIVEFLNPDQYNDNTSLAENILFGASNLQEFCASGLAVHPTLQPLLQEYELAETLDESAVSAATTMVELFSDLPAGHEFFARYSLVDAEDLVQLKRILGLLEKNSNLDQLSIKDRTLLSAIPFTLIGGRHRVGILSDDEKKKVVQLRTAFAERLSTESREQIEFFSPERYNAFLPVSENIIFGRIVYGRLGAEEKVYAVMLDVLQELDLMHAVIDIGLTAPVGLAGSLLSVAQRQKLSLARGLIKQPELLVINDGISAIDGEETRVILSNIKRDHPDIGVLWVDNQVRFPDLFDRYAHMQSGKLTKIEETDGKTSLTKSDDADKQSRNKAASKDENSNLALLSNVPLFSMMESHQLQLLASGCDSITIAQGERLFSQGDTGDALYVIVDGKAGVFIEKAGKEEKMGEFGVNEVIGELALLSDNPRSASVDAISDLTMLRLKREAFVDIVRSNGEIGYQILQMIINRFSDANSRTEQPVES